MYLKFIANIDESTKLEFICHSNKIETIDIPLTEYRRNSSHLEITGHLAALDYMLNSFAENLTAKKIKKIHHLLMSGILPPDKTGHFRNGPCVIIGKKTSGEKVIIDRGAPPQTIAREMQELLKNIHNKKTESQLWDFHHDFEIIHPFFDGNGRVGRILLNWLRLQKGYPLLIVRFEERSAYYQRIVQRRNEKIMLQLFLEDYSRASHFIFK